MASLLVVLTLMLVPSAVDGKRSPERDNCHLEEKKLQHLQLIIENSPVALFGWSGCPCTSIAHKRLESKAVCFQETVWSQPDNDVFKYLQCKYGNEHHSFLFFKGEFKGNGFIMEEESTRGPELDTWIQNAHAAVTCPVEGEKSLSGQDLESCSRDSDNQKTGWTRTGSCNWEPSDGGYHEVCVTMSDEFLQQSAKKDANDLSSVVQPEGHWCICAWAFAGAVQRDPENLEGLQLNCDRTNLKLVEVYVNNMGGSLTSPSGAQYPVDPALEKVFKLCPNAKAEAEKMARGGSSFLNLRNAKQ